MGLYPKMKWGRLFRTMKRILLVDDIIDVQSLVAGLLRNTGAHIDAASNGNEASKLLATHQYDLVITDLNMPVEDGFSIIYKLRNTISGVREVPIIVITAGNTFSVARGLDYNKSIEEITKINKLKILKKPFSKHQLLEMVCESFEMNYKRDEELWLGDAW